MSRPEISVVVPCLNEQDNLPLLAARLFEASDETGIDVELVPVDDGSTDGTWDTIERLALEHPGRVTGVRHATNQGIAAGWTSGIQAARGRYVCLIDADLQHHPEDVFALYGRLMDSTADMAQGVRLSADREWNDPRLRASRGLNSLLNFAFRSSARDSKSGFVLGPKSVMADIVHHTGTYHYFQSFISVSARARGYEVVEVDTEFVERHAGTSFIEGRTVSTSLKALSDIPRAMREFGGERHPYRGTVAGGMDVPAAPHPYTGWRRAWFELFFATMPLHKWMLRRSARSLYLELKATEWLDREQLEALRLQKLQRIVQHAYHHVPYYRERFEKAGVHPTDIEDLTDLSELPLLEKQTLREELDSLMSDNHDPERILKIATSGSTGQPLVTYADKYQLEVRFATTLRALEWTGWRFGDKQARLWHQTLGMSRSQVIREHIDAWFMRRMFVPAFEITPENIDEFVGRIDRHDPVLVDGYAESLNFLAEYVSSGATPGFSPKAIMSSAQALPEPTRRTIEAGFDTRVFDKYGSREFSGIAYQCEASDDHHVQDESYIVELLVEGRPAQPGEVGEVVITDLNNFSVPLIRYRIGDLALAVDDTDTCGCGRSMRRIGRIEGRTQAIVYCANGAWIPGTFFAHFFKDYDDAVRHFQVYQEEPGAFVLRVVPTEGYRDERAEAMLEHLAEYVGDTEVSLELTDTIPMVRTGKRSPVVSLVRNDFQTVQAKAEQD